jgi:transposase-like protein
MGMNQCLHCGSEALVKAGRNASGSQRYHCKRCKRHSTLEPETHGYSEEMHAHALRLYLEGTGLRRIGRLLQIHHQTAANWINARHATLPAEPAQPPAAAVIELDELYTFVDSKKTNST